MGNVEIGVMQRDGLREITSGLKAKERVIVDTKQPRGPARKFGPISFPCRQ